MFKQTASFDIINITVFYNMLKLYTQLTDIDKHVSLCWIRNYVGKKGNKMADKAAKKGICSVITQNKIPPESFLLHISKLCMEKWQDSRDSTTTNKLFFNQTSTWQKQTAYIIMPL